MFEQKKKLNLNAACLYLALVGDYVFSFLLFFAIAKYLVKVFACPLREYYDWWHNLVFKLLLR